MGAALNQGAGTPPEGAPSTVRGNRLVAELQAGFRGALGRRGDAIRWPGCGGRGGRGHAVFGMHMARRGRVRVSRKSSDAPDFTLESLDGKSMRLSDLRGKAVLLNFWAPWCGPCKIETPWLVQLQNQYGSTGLQVVGVEMGDHGKDEIAKFVKEMGMNIPCCSARTRWAMLTAAFPRCRKLFSSAATERLWTRLSG
jgi:hypothetical protein